MINLELLAEKGAIAMGDLELFQFADTPEDAFAILKEGLTENILSRSTNGRSGGWRAAKA